MKDKNRPRSPLSSFACFTQVIRDKHRSLHPNENVIFSELAKRCAEKWREMPPSKRAPFEEMSRIDTKRYNREMSEYVHQQQQQQQQMSPQMMMHMQSQGTGGHSGTCDVQPLSHHTHHMRGGKRRRLKDPGMPKRALSAFFFFCHKYRPKVRAEHPEWRVSDIAKELGRLWDECTEKGPYELEAQKDKLRYEDEMRRYKEGTFIMSPKRMRDVGGAVGDEMSGNASVANCFEIEGSREVDEMDGDAGDDEIDQDDEEEEEEDEEMEDEEEEEDVENNEVFNRGMDARGAAVGSGNLTAEDGSVVEDPRQDVGADDRNKMEASSGGVQDEAGNLPKEADTTGRADEHGGEDEEGATELGEEEEEEEEEGDQEGYEEALNLQQPQRQPQRNHATDPFSVAAVVSENESL